jgi:hypothetical protein
MKTKTIAEIKDALTKLPREKRLAALRLGLALARSHPIRGIQSTSDNVIHVNFGKLS